MAAIWKMRALAASSSAGPPARSAGDQPRARAHSEVGGGTCRHHGGAAVGASVRAAGAAEATRHAGRAAREDHLRVPMSANGRGKAAESSMAPRRASRRGEASQRCN
eukprot:11550557-Alexandrium_andersonii.AAC.1